MMIDKIMNHFGFMRKIDHLEQMEEFRVKCRDFAEDCLRGEGNTVKTNGRIDGVGPNESARLTVIGDRVMISNSFVKKLEVAPWCKNCFIQAIYKDKP